MKWECPARPNWLASEYSGHSLKMTMWKGFWACSACGGTFVDAEKNSIYPTVEWDSVEMLLYRVSIMRGAADRGTSTMTADDVAVLKFLEREGLP